MAHIATWPNWTETRYRFIGISRCGRQCIRYVCLDFEGGGTTRESPAAIGPIFPTVAEAYARLTDYAEANYPELTLAGAP